MLIFGSKIIKEKEKENTKPPHLAYLGQKREEREKENLKSKKTLLTIFCSLSLGQTIYTHNQKLKTHQGRIKSKNKARRKVE